LATFSFVRTSKPSNVGPIIPETLNCKLLKVAAEGNSAS
jgi:hypothetical protein